MPGHRGRCLVCLVVALTTASSIAAEPFVSALDRPDEPGPVYVSVGPTYGGSPDYAPVTWGFAGSLLFRPDRAVDFFEPLYHANTAMVVETEWHRVTDDRTIRTGDIVLRKYLGETGRHLRSPVLFAGLGGGIARVTYPVEPDTTGNSGEEPVDPATLVTTIEDLRWLSLVVEFGYESEPWPDVVLTAKGQWRSFVKRPIDYSGWAFHVLVGVPVPW